VSCRWVVLDAALAGLGSPSWVLFGSMAFNGTSEGAKELVYVLFICDLVEMYSTSILTDVLGRFDILAGEYAPNCLCVSRYASVGSVYGQDPMWLRSCRTLLSSYLVRPPFRSLDAHDGSGRKLLAGYYLHIGAGKVNLKSNNMVHSAASIHIRCGIYIQRPHNNSVSGIRSSHSLQQCTKALAHSNPTIPYPKRQSHAVTHYIPVRTLSFSNM
jgi:hypothetical protein